MNVRIVPPGCFGEMRKTGTIGRSDGINAALIGLEVQELAGLLFIDCILITVFHQPLLVKLLWRLAKMSGYAPDIRFTKSRCHLLTAIGTRKAVDLLPYLFLHRNRK